jgi:hypothetical protein
MDLSESYLLVIIIATSIVVLRELFAVFLGTRKKFVDRISAQLGIPEIKDDLLYMRSKGLNQEYRAMMKEEYSIRNEEIVEWAAELSIAKQRGLNGKFDAKASLLQDKFNRQQNNR